MKKLFTLMHSLAFPRLAILICLISVFFTSGKLNATNLISQNFSNWTAVGSWTSSTVPVYVTIPVGVSTGQVTLYAYTATPTKAASGTGSVGVIAIRPSASNGVLILPVLSSCGTVEIRSKSLVTSASTMKLQKSSDGTTWTDVATITSPASTSGASTQVFTINQTTSTYLKFSGQTNATEFHDIIVTDYVTSGTASPALTAATGATVDGTFNVTFTDVPAWRDAITSIKIGTSTLDASAYTKSAGIIQFTPLASTLLQSAGTKSITVIATGYMDAVVSQAIAAGAATQLVVQTQPTAPAGSGLTLVTQPVVKIADQYGNATSSTEDVTASVNGSTAWVLNGTKTKAAVAGIATFTDLTATNEFTGASITFTSGAWSVNSSTFNIPPAIVYSTAIVNPGFENAIGTEWTLTGTSIITDLSNVYAGSKAAHMNANNQMYQIVNLEPNTVYDISCYAKVVGASASTLLGVTEYVGNVFIKSTPITSTSYQKYTFSFTTSSAVQYKIWGWTSTAGDYYFDNFEINKQFAWTGIGNWSNTANWTPASLPTATASVLVNSGTLTFDENASVASVTVASGATLNVAAGKGLTVNSLVNSGNVELLSDPILGTATILASSATGSGTTKANQYLGTTRNWYVSSPLTNAKTPATGYTSYKYDETGSNTGFVAPATLNWVSVPASTEMVPGTGYIALPGTASATITFTTETGGTINTGDVNVTLTKSGSGFNLIGNPYPSHLTWTADFVNETANAALIEPTIWVRTNSGSSNIGGWSYTTYNAAVSESVPYANVLIAPMQAFWVKAKIAGTLILDDKLIRSHVASNSNPLKAPAVKNADRQRLRLQVDNGTKTDETLIYFDANALDSYDRFDSPKYMETSATATQLYTTVGTEKLVINGMKSVQLDTPIALGFISGNASSFSIKATEVSNLASDIKLILKDNVTLAETDLTNGTSTYDFTLNNSSANRFSLIFRTAGSVTDIANTKQLNFMAYSNVKGKITVKTKEILDETIQVSVYNAVGQKLVTQSITNTITKIEGNFTQGIYVVKVNNSVSKVIVK